MANSTHANFVKSELRPIARYKGSTPRGSVNFPFQIILHSIDVNNQEVRVKVSPYSFLLTEFSTQSNKEILGLDFHFPIVYGNKVYLEIWLDKLGKPVAPKIKYGNKWESLVVSPLDISIETPTYPKEVELITKHDIDNKKEEIGEEIEANTLQLTEHKLQIDALVEAKTITADKGTLEKERLERIYNEANQDLRIIRGSLTTFFDGSSALRRKQIKSFVMIGYTSRDTDGLLLGQNITPPVELDTSSGGVKTTIENPAFKIVQALNTNLLVSPVEYSRIPCKHPIPWHQPVHSFVVNGEEEEITNTRDDS